MPRTAVVTGATGGIGRWIALGLAQAGLQVILVGRNDQSGAATLQWIKAQTPEAQTPEAKLVFLRTDLSSMAEAAALGRRIAADHPTLALLVNNAGIFRARRTVTPEGVDEVLAVNLLAPFILMRELERPLRAGASSRIVTVGSSTSDHARLDPATIGTGPGWGMVRSYAQSKLAVMMATFAWAAAMQGSGVVAHVVHPGTVATGLVRTPGVIGLAWRLMAPWIKTERDGAGTPLHAALAPGCAHTTGLYFKDRAPVSPNPMARDAALCQRVWDAADRLTKPF